MIVEQLAIIAVSISFLSAFLCRFTVNHSTHTKAFILSFIPLCISLYLIVFPESLSIKGIGVSSGALLSFALKYSAAQQVSPTYEAELLFQADQIFGLTFSWVFLVLSLIMVFSAWKNSKFLNLITAVCISALLIIYHLQIPVSLMQINQGEAGVRAFIDLGLIEKKNLLSLIPPTEAWQYHLSAAPLLLYALISSVALSLISLMKIEVIDFRIAKRVTAICALSLLLLLVVVSLTQITSTLLFPLVFPAILLSISAVLSQVPNHLLWISLIAMLGLMV